MTRRAAFREQAWPEDPVFNDLALEWSGSASAQMLGWVWRAFDALRAGPMAQVDLTKPLEQLEMAQVDLTKPLEQLERDLTDLHFREIQRLWAGETGGIATFYPDHEIPEFESRQPAPAQPPTYDLGFVLYGNPRIIWPIEAKVVRKATVLTTYLSDVRDKFVAGIAAPFVGEAGMIGYLLAGTAAEVFSGLERELSQPLNHPSAFNARDHKTSFHSRGRSPFGRDLPHLLLHHLVMACSSNG